MTLKIKSYLTLLFDINIDPHFLTPIFDINETKDFF